MITCGGFQLYFSTYAILNTFPMEVSRPGWKFHVHNLLHSMSEVAYFSSLFLDPLSHPHTPFSRLANHGPEALTDG